VYRTALFLSVAYTVGVQLTQCLYFDGHYGDDESPQIGAQRGAKYP